MPPRIGRNAVRTLLPNLLVVVVLANQKTKQPAAFGQGQLWGATKADGNHDGGNSVQGFRPSNFTSANTANPPIKEDATSRP